VCYIRTRTACIAQLLAQEDIISAFFYNNIISTCWQSLRDCITASKFLTQIIHTQKNKKRCSTPSRDWQIKGSRRTHFFHTRALARNAEYAAFAGGRRWPPSFGSIRHQGTCSPVIPIYMYIRAGLLYIIYLLIPYTVYVMSATVAE
jgi:hypothetical protein